jgi:hypothetical protein
MRALNVGKDFACKAVFARLEEFCSKSPCLSSILPANMLGYYTLQSHQTGKQRKQESVVVWELVRINPICVNIRVDKSDSAL